MAKGKQVPTIDVHPPLYKDGHTAVQYGYIYELRPGHPSQNYWGYVPQHRLVAEEQIGRYLLSSEVVHHKDENPLNNHPDNLEVMTRAAHYGLHNRQRGERVRAHLTVDVVRAHLRHYGLNRAAQVLGVHSQTLRNHFPDLVAPYKRRTPTNIDDPSTIAAVLQFASDSSKSLKDVAQETGMAAMTVKRICQRHGMEWVKKSRKGETRRTYRRKKPIPVW